MIFQHEGEFQRFPHCKFKETVLRVLLVPSIEDGNILVAVSKYGSVGLYDSSSLTLIHTYILDTSNSTSQAYSALAKPQIHIIVDAFYADDLKLIVFATTKGELQCFDIGGIETFSLGTEMLPRKEFNGIKHRISPCQVRNKGHVETHRILGLDSVPSCIFYSQADTSTGSESMSKILIGDCDGSISIIFINNSKTPFLNCRKIRGVVHFIHFKELKAAKKVQQYRGHYEAVKDIQILEERETIVSCSRDRDYSLFCKDLKDISQPMIASVPVGINCLTHSNPLKILIAGCNDGILRIFCYLSLSHPKYLIDAHKCSIVGVEILSPLLEDSILITYSVDVEIRAWDPQKFTCLQNQYLRFSRNLPIFCKTPEFGRKSLTINSIYSNSILTPLRRSESKGKEKSNENKEIKRLEEYLIVLYSNSYVRLDIEKNSSSEFSLLNILFEELNLQSFKKRNEKVNLDPYTKLDETEEKEIQEKSKATKNRLLQLRNAKVLTHEDKLVGGVNEEQVEKSRKPSLIYLPKKSLRGKRTIERKGIFHSIPFYDIQDPKCNVDYQPIV